jgi:hypothetical protein
MSRFHDDSAELARRLEDRLEDILSRYWPTWIKVRNKGLLTPKIKGKQKKPTSSFTVDLSGNRRGQWYRFSQSKGGGAIALLYYGEHGDVPNSKEDWAEAFKLTREFLGITQQRQETEEERQAREARRAKEQREREDRERREAADRARREEARRMGAAEVWKASQRLQGTLGEAYLVGRGLPPVSEWPWDCHDTLRFHPSLDYEKDYSDGIRPVRRFPALVGNVVDAFGNTISVWQVYLCHDKPEKAPVDNAKIGRGSPKGGAVRIGGMADRIGGAEGMETAIGLWALEGFRKPVWSFLSTSGMENFEPPMNVTHVSIYPDGDKAILQNGKILDPPGMKSAQVLRERMQAIGVGSNINEMAILGDGLDLWNTRNEIERKKQIA